MILTTTLWKQFSLISDLIHKLSLQSVYILSIFFKRYLFTFRPWKIYVRVLKTTVMLVNWQGKSREYLKSPSFTPPRRHFHLDGSWLYCKESLWIRSEICENCFHSVVVKIILINYAKKKLIHVWAGGNV
jgi:hypothetical protein